MTTRADGAIARHRAVKAGRRWPRQIFTTVLVAVLLSAAAVLTTTSDRVVTTKMADHISQYGITWNFDRLYPVGQFVTGDWWVLGPVTVVAVTPGPTTAPGDERNSFLTNMYGDTGLRDDRTRRNGSMVVVSPGPTQGYDSRGISYDANASISFPHTLAPETSLISSISQRSAPNKVMQSKLIWPSAAISNSVLKTAAILTSLADVPPSDAFRPSYAGVGKQIFRASDLHWDRLGNFPVDDMQSVVPTFSQYERYLQRPWIDHFNGAWETRWLTPLDNQPDYGREVARIVGTASLMLNLDAPRERKRRLLYELVQYGIDLEGIVRLGGHYNEGGGITSGRKWPILFAGLLLGEPSFISTVRRALFHEDAQTYYGQGWYGQKALWQIVKHHGPRQPYQEKPPQRWDKWDWLSEKYRVCCTARAWVGEGLAALLMGAKADWHHDAFFDYLDDWMRKRDKFAANRLGHRRPSTESTAFDPFVAEFWRLHRGDAPPTPIR